MEKIKAKTTQHNAMLEQCVGYAKHMRTLEEVNARPKVNKQETGIWKRRWWNLPMVYMNFLLGKPRGKLGKYNVVCYKCNFTVAEPHMSTLVDHLYTNHHHNCEVTWYDHDIGISGNLQMPDYRTAFPKPSEVKKNARYLRDFFKQGAAIHRHFRKRQCKDNRKRDSFKDALKQKIMDMKVDSSFFRDSSHKGVDVYGKVMKWIGEVCKDIEGDVTSVGKTTVQGNMEDEEEKEELATNIYHPGLPSSKRHMIEAAYEETDAYLRPIAEMEKAIKDCDSSVTADKYIKYFTKVCNTRINHPHTETWADSVHRLFATPKYRHMSASGKNNYIKAVNFYLINVLKDKGSTIPLQKVKSNYNKNILDADELDEERMALLKQKYGGKPSYIAFMISTFFGLRAHEIALVHVRDMDVVRDVAGDKYVHFVIPKGKGTSKPRSLDNYDTYAIELVEHLKSSYTGYLFADKELDKLTVDKQKLWAVSKGNALSKMVSRITNNIWKRRLSLHTLRHTFATSLWAKGVKTEVIQMQLRHSSHVTTEKYLSQQGRSKAALSALKSAGNIYMAKPALDKFIPPTEKEIADDDMFQTLYEKAEKASKIPDYCTKEGKIRACYLGKNH